MQRIDNACAISPSKPYLITWFIYELKSSVNREMKKARRYATFSKVAMDREDEGASSDEATTFEPITLAKSHVHVQVEDRTGPT